MSEGALQLSRAGASLVAVLVALVLQRLAPHARHRGSWRVNTGLWLVNTLVVGAICGGCAFTVARWATANRVGVLSQVAVGAPWVAIPVTLLFLDLVSWAWHRANHAVPLLWRLHRVHHSDPAFTVSTGVRFHPGELVLSLPVRLLTIILVGAPVEAVLAFEAVFTLANLVEHGDINVARGVERTLGHLFITPALHRRHHTKSGPERDSNFGAVFSAWDRLFRTYTQSDSGTTVETGLPGVAGNITLSGVLTLPLRRLVA